MKIEVVAMRAGRHRRVGGMISAVDPRSPNRGAWSSVVRLVAGLAFRAGWDESTSSDS